MKILILGAGRVSESVAESLVDSFTLRVTDADGEGGQIALASTQPNRAHQPVFLSFQGITCELKVRRATS